jgi:PAS domain S-box-containing protein
VLVLAPLVNDARLTARVLERAGIEALACGSVDDLLACASHACGALLLAEEGIASAPETAARIGDFLARQPSWSDLPVIVITSGGELSLNRRRRLSSVGPSGNVMLIERPFHPGTLVSTVEVALRSRERQYQVQALLEESVRHKDELEFILHAGGLGAWRVELPGRALSCSATCKLNFGLRPDEELSYARLASIIHPDDVGPWERAVEAAIRGAGTFDVEYRVTTPAGELRWIHAHGRAAMNAEGTPTHLAGVTQNITDRKAAARALEEQAALLREADRRKDEFVAMLAHELRNPLASVSSAITLIKEAPEDAENRTWAVSVIERQNRQLARLVDDLLDVSRITRGKIELRRELLDAAKCIESACDAVAPLIAERNHTLLAEIPPGELWLQADPTRLEQIVGNLLANAAKYSEPHGQIWLNAHREGPAGGAEIVIVVRDAGIGIPPERIGEMFDLFAQGERTIARSEGGLGIGLTVVKGLCELHGGSITAHSDGAGQGSTFTVRLPAAAAPPAGAAAEGSGGNSAAAAEGERLLLVDDNVDSAQALGRLLGRRGYQVQLAFDGHAAVDQARVFRPEVVLLDIGLPGLDGYQVARALRTDPVCADAFIVAVSGYGREEDRRLSRASGFDHHLVKPLNFEELLGLLQKRAAVG